MIFKCLLLAMLSSAPVNDSTVVRDIDISLNQTRISAGVGERLEVESRLTNTGATSTDKLIVHLNVASLDGTYVDLEDWSAEVTREIKPLAPGGSTMVSWQFQAVNVGNFDVYVVAMPNGADTAGSGPLIASAPVHVTVAGKKTLNPIGSLPVLIMVPVLLGLAVAAVRYRRLSGTR